MERSDWTALSLAAERTGLAGLVLAWAGEDGVQGVGEIPNDVLERLRRSASLVAANNMNCLAQLEKALVVLRRADIGALLLKGAALNLTLYDRPDLRPMSDVDVLVRPEHGVAAQRVLMGNGWREGQELVRPDFFPRFYYATELHYASRVPVRLDLHVRPFRPLRLACTVPDSALWADSASVQCGGECAGIPSHERMFIHLAAHAAFHGLSRLIWLYDIDAYARRYGHEINWAQVAVLAGRWRLAPAVHKVAQAVTVLLSTPFPSDFADDLGKQTCNWADRLCLHQAPRDAGAPIRHVLANWVCTPDRSLAYPYLLAYLLPGRRHLETIYRPRHFGWVVAAHIWRPVRVAIRGTRWLLRRLARSSYGAVFPRRAVRVSA